MVFRRDRHDITVSEAISAVEGYGGLSRIEPLDPELTEALEIRSAIFIEFAQFDCERDLVNVSPSL